MIGMIVRTRSEIPKVIRKAERKNPKTLGHAAGLIRITARRSIRRRKKPAPRGQPPHTQTGRLPKAILYAVEKAKHRAVIGTSRNLIGICGAEHEQNVGWRKPPIGSRPFMAPALEKITPRLPAQWRGFLR